jgi:protein-L-isoaspartate(D-aspartate) O-methyltransferase
VHTRSVEEARAAYAEKIRALAGLRSPGLLRALARVPREDFVGPGPWKIVSLATLGPGYRDTPDADPRHLYDNVLVALDPERRLNNGEPAALLRWLDSLALAPGEQFLHVGCGVGYYTAIAAEAVQPGGRTVGIEIDPELAQRARRNTAGIAGLEIRGRDGSAAADETFDAVFVNAGATDVLPAWLDLLRPGGRLLLPLTVSVPNMTGGVGRMLMVRRTATGYTGEFQGMVGVFHCAGARSEAGEARLRARLTPTGLEGARSLRRDAHAEVGDCWLHGDSFCLSAVRA